MLADVLKNFINTCLEYYGLDPCHYLSGPGLSWDEVLKMTEIEFELISDIDMYLFIEKRMKKGISYIAKRISKANKKYIKSYDDNKPTIYIIYLDANNLYGWAMIQYLPYSGFKCLSQKEIEKFDVNSIGENSSAGYILEADLEYPDELDELNNDYPLAPVNLKLVIICCQNIAVILQINLA